MEEVTKMKALHTPNTVEACFGNKERAKRAHGRREEEEKMKAGKEPIGNEEFNRKTLELLQSSDDEETNTNNGGSSGEEGQDHFSEALQRCSSFETALRPWDLLVANHCSRNHI
jgi:hypothetical protein